MFMLPLFARLRRIAELTPFPFILPGISGGLQLHHPLWNLEGTSDLRGGKIFGWVISSDLLPLNNPDTPSLLNRSSGSGSFPDPSFASSFLAPERWFRTLALIIYQFY